MKDIIKEIREHDAEYTRLFREYSRNRKNASYASGVYTLNDDGITDKRVISLLDEFSNGNREYSRFLDEFFSKYGFKLQDALKDSTLFYGQDGFKPSNNEEMLISLVHALEHVREREMLERNGIDYSNQNFEYDPMREVFPMAREKEMALFLIDKGYNVDNVRNIMNLHISENMEAMKKYAKMGLALNTKRRTKAKIEAFPYAYGDILSSTIVLKCGGDFDDVQNSLVCCRESAYSEQVFSDIGCDKDDLIPNGGKVLSKIYEPKKSNR